MDFVFPNDLNVTWSVLIVLYPYITGLVAGAFIVSSLYHVFHREALAPIARFSLASALIFLLFAPLPLLIHLGHPERAFNIMITPHFTSAMAGFGYIYAAYLILVVLEMWFVIRGDLIRRAQGGGAWAWLARVLLLFDLHSDDETRAVDGRIVRILAAIGIPLACLLHGYVGFLFGSLKANPWWSTPLMFVIFIFSAIVSGIAVLIFHYFVVCWIKRWQVDQQCVRLMTTYLWGFMIVAVSLELLEVMSIAYNQTDDWEILSELIWHKLFISYVLLQFFVFALVPFIMLGIVTLAKPRTWVANALTWTAATMLLAQVLLMRWNVVIGGQLLSKSMRGFTSYFPGIWEKEGLAMTALVFTLPFFILYLYNRFIPLFPGAKPRETPS